MMAVIPQVSWADSGPTRADLGSTWAAGPVPKARKWPRHARGSILRTWRPFWTHFRTIFADLGPDGLSDLSTTAVTRSRIDRSTSGSATEVMRIETSSKLSHDPSARPQTIDFLTFLADFGPRDWSQTLGNGRRIHLGGFSRPGDRSGPIWGHFRRFRARPPIWDLNIVTLPQLRLLRNQQCVLRQNRCLLLQQRASKKQLLSSCHLALNSSLANVNELSGPC